MQSVLSEPHFDSGDDYLNWKFTSVAHGREDAKGRWNLTVSDLCAGSTCLVNAWSVTIYGYVQDLAHVWTNFNHSGIETGEAARPFHTLSGSLGIVSVSGTVHIRAGSATMATMNNQALTVKAEGGLVRLGN